MVSLDVVYYCNSPSLIVTLLYLTASSQLGSVCPPTTLANSLLAGLRGIDSGAKVIGEDIIVSASLALGGLIVCLVVCLLVSSSFYHCFMLFDMIPSSDCRIDTVHALALSMSKDSLVKYCVCY
jgi:hypothetical protein